MLKDRTPRGARLLDSCAVDAFAFFSPANIRYLCGFTGSDGVLVVCPDESVFLTDSRYITQARQQVAATKLQDYRIKVDGVADLIKAGKIARIGFEAEYLSYATVARLQESTPGCEWVPVEKEIQSLRGTKDAAEIAHLEAASLLNSDAFEEILPLIRPGAVEKEIALALEFALRRRGGEEKAFDFIVASGPRGALPCPIEEQN